jgi:iron complex outermembrane recepter protein
MRGMGVRRVHGALLVALGVMLCTPVAHADEPAPRTAPKAKASKRSRSAGVGMDQLTVTARRRPEYIQETPVSITAFSELDLEQGGFTRIDDIGRFTPNVSFSQNGGTQENGRAIIRGIGTSDPQETRDPGVGVYIDDVYIARSQGMLLPVLDIERIEVLRGPQGTLYGRNTIGGAVKVVTRAPSEELEGFLQVRGGNFNLFETKGIINIPIASEIAAMRAAFTSVTRDGYTDNQFTGKKNDDRHLLAGRLEFRFNPTPDIEARLHAEQTRAHNRGRGGECRFRADAVAATGQLITFENALFNFQNNCNNTRADGDEYEYMSPVRPDSDAETLGLNTTLEWETEAFNAKSISAWRRIETENTLDFTFAATNIGVSNAETDEQDQVSQEFNITGNPFGDSITWTGGLYWFYEKLKPGRDMTDVAFNLCQAVNIALTCNPSFTQNLGIRTDAFAAYTQATFEVTEQLNFTAGIRRSVERKEFTQFTFNYLDNMRTQNPAGTLDIQRSNRFDAWTPLFTASFDATPDVMFFATYSRGFKSGGFNGRPAANVAATLEPFEQEKLDNFELGLKSALLDNRLFTNVTFYRSKFQDIQQTVLSSDPNTGGLAASVQNAAEAIIQGMELEVGAQFIKNLDVKLGVGIARAQFTELDEDSPVINPITGMPVDNSSLRLNNTPAANGHLTATYLIPLGFADLSTRASWYHRGRVTYGPISRTLDESKVGVLSSRITLALADGKTEFSLWGENLLDRRYLNDGLNFEDGFSASLGYYAAPRMYGIEVRRKF